MDFQHNKAEDVNRHRDNTGWYSSIIYLEFVGCNPIRQLFLMPANEALRRVGWGANKVWRGHAPRLVMARALPAYRTAIAG